MFIILYLALIALIGWSVGYLIWRIVRSCTGKGGCGCSCGGCKTGCGSCAHRDACPR